MKQRRNTYFVIGAAFLSLFASFVPSRTMAAPGINLQISPLPIEISAKPGQTIVTDLRVRNGGTETEKLQLQLLKVTQDDHGEVHLGTPGPDDEYTNWVSFSRPIFDAPPNEWQTISMTIKIPPTAAFGYYFAVKYARAVPDQPLPGQAVAQGAVATFILLDVDAPGAKRTADVTSFKSEKKWYEFLPATFTTNVHSTGNVHVAPHGTIFIQHRGKDIASIPVNADRSNILPGAGQFYNSQWNDGFPHYEAVIKNGQPSLDKNGAAKKHLVWNFGQITSLRIGKYTAKEVLVFDNGTRDEQLSNTTTFWVFPWKLVLGALILIALISLGFATTLKSIWGSTRRLKRSRR